MDQECLQLIWTILEKEVQTMIMMNMKVLFNKMMTRKIYNLKQMKFKILFKIKIKLGKF